MEKTVASNIISKFGGAYKLSEVIGIDVSQIYRWTYPKEKGGTGGSIPARHFSTILNDAEKMGIKLSLEELISISNTKKVKSKRSN